MTVMMSVQDVNTILLVAMGNNPFRSKVIVRHLDPFGCTQFKKNTSDTGTPVIAAPMLESQSRTLYGNPAGTVRISGTDSKQIYKH